MSFANPLGLLALAGIIPIVALHILRPRRRAVTVPSTFLWKRIERPVSSAAPWQKLRPSWLLLAQLLAVTALAIVLAQPQRQRETPLAQHTVFVIDASGSMRAIDGKPDRLGAAKDRARALRRKVPAGGIASVVVAGQRARVALSASSTTAEFDSAVNAIRADEGTPAIADAFTLAASLDRGDVPTSVVVISDGGFTPDERALVPRGARYERIGERSTNRAITRLTAEERGSGLHVRAEVRNTGGPTVRQPIRIDVDGRTEASGDLALESNALGTFEADVPPGRRVEAFLDGEDLLAADNRAVAVIPERRSIKVFLAGDDRFMAQVLAVVPGAEVTRAAGGRPGANIDVAIYNGVAVPADVAVPVLAIAVPGGLPDVTPSGLVDRPSLTTVRTDGDLLAGLDLSDVAIATTQKLSAPLATVQVGSVETPLLVTGTQRGLPYAYLGFALTDSNLPLQVAFPILIDRLLSSLAGSGQSTQSVTVGDPLPVNPAVEMKLIAPDGTARRTRIGDPPPSADQAGFWVLQTPAATDTAAGSATTLATAIDAPVTDPVVSVPDRLVAVNVPPRESQLDPLLDLVIAPEVPNARKVVNGRTASPLLAPFVIALLVLLLAEWLLARRGNAVPKRQWRWSVALRAVVAALALLALIAPELNRQANAVATIFVVDGSASLGPSGRASAAEWVRAALDAKPKDARTGVVVFGGDARLDIPVAATATFTRQEVTVDEKATNLATAIRLGTAVAPTDARRRIVLVSDGLATRGDTDAALTDALTAGIPIDTHAVGGAGGPDVAVASVKGPPIARVGDTVTLTATLSSNIATTAEVTLERDGRAIASKVVDIKPGDTAVSVADPSPPSGGLARYRVRVRSATDSVADNDAASVGVPIDGPARVLIVEGSKGESDTLATALKAGGIGGDVVSTDNIPNLDALSSYTGIVFVDVDVRAVPAESMEAVTRAVRDLGRGLTTIGGPRSYGVGGYRNSALEELLPVISDVTDPKRRQKVAQVLSIDTSGSMAACHCRPEATGGLPNGGNRIGGGVNKTDIAKAAVVRTAAALSDTDEIGIVAFNGNAKVIMDLQQNPGSDVVTSNLAPIKPGGGTFIAASLTKAAEELRGSDAALKHIIVFSDGFTASDNLDAVAKQAKDLYENDGITVSVLATGEGAAPALEKIAIAGNGRFYLGGDLSRVPQIMAEEAVMASRNFVNEGKFLPEVVSSSQVVRNLTSSPELLGYVATTAKPTGSTLLRIGDERDPLLASWQVGLGRSTAWTSDANARWSSQWVNWDGYVGFWTQLVKDTFPVSAAGGAATAEASNGTVKVSLVGSTAFPDQSKATARVVGPDGRSQEVELSRTDANTFTGEAAIDGQGVYAVGANATNGRGETVLTATALATQAYSPEYRPAPADVATLERVSAATKGRAGVDPKAVWDAAGLKPGRRPLRLRGPLLLAAVLLWPFAVALSRIVSRRGALAGAARAMGRSVPRPPKMADIAASSSGAAPVRAGASEASPGATSGSTEVLPAPAPPPAAEVATLQQLLKRKRGES
jgi:Mg-chelatase subunit ChlD